MSGPIINIDEVPLREQGDGANFVAKWGRVGPEIGMTGLGCAVHIVPPGKKAFPFHRHHVIDEIFFIVSGTGEYRYGERRLPLRAGDIVAAPAGGEAHQIINTGKENLRYLGFSTAVGADIVEYPDSGKVAMAAGIKNADFRTATYKAMGRVAPAGYFDGES
ncbi:MAG: cupin domain-containing protein [Pseudolabrys sp.]|nr:cupin domain-containing protein [Pseudolabrys sp.]